MGEPRFTYGALREVLGGRSYALRAAIWPGGVPSLHQVRDRLAHVCMRRSSMLHACACATPSWFG